MEDHSTKRHPGPWRVMNVDSEFAGLLVAVGFLVMGLVSMPIATVFVLGTIVLGVVVALLLRFIPRKFSRAMVATIIILAPFVFWWEGHTPRRPLTVSSNALYVVPKNLQLRFRQAGYWLECWFDQHENVDRCKLTDENGIVSFEDVFLPRPGHTPLPQSELVFQRETGRSWIQSCDKRINVPVIYLPYGQGLIPRSLYIQATQEVHCD
jgi:hypothetical protein